MISCYETRGLAEGRLAVVEVAFIPHDIQRLTMQRDRIGTAEDVYGIKGGGRA